MKLLTEDDKRHTPLCHCRVCAERAFERRQWQITVALCIMLAVGVWLLCTQLNSLP